MLQHGRLLVSASGPYSADQTIDKSPLEYKVYIIRLLNPPPRTADSDRIIPSVL